MKSREEIEACIKQCESAIQLIKKDIKNNYSYEFHDLLIDQKITNETTIKILKWVLNA